MRAAWGTFASKLSLLPQPPRATLQTGYGVTRHEDPVDLLVSEISVVPATQSQQTLWRSLLFLSESYLGWDWREAHVWRKLP